MIAGHGRDVAAHGDYVYQWWPLRAVEKILAKMSKMRVEVCRRT